MFHHDIGHNVQSNLPAMDPALVDGDYNPVHRLQRAGGRRVDRRNARGLRYAVGRDVVKEPPEGKRLDMLLLRSHRPRYLMCDGRRGKLRMSLRYSDWEDLSTSRRSRRAFTLPGVPTSTSTTGVSTLQRRPTVSAATARAGSVRATNT